MLLLRLLWLPDCPNNFRASPSRVCLLVMVCKFVFVFCFMDSRQPKAEIYARMSLLLYLIDVQ